MLNFPEIKPLDRSGDAAITAKLNSLTKPVGSLGMLERTAARLAAIQRTVKPQINKKRVYVFASDHGIALEGVSAYPQEVTAQMVLNFISGGAAINVFSRHTGTDVFVVDAGIKADISVPHDNLIIRKAGRSTKSFLREPAMTETQAETCLKHGFELAEEAFAAKTGIIALGDMGIGNTTVAAAVCAAAGMDIDSVIDIGTVIDENTLKHKRGTVARALEARNPDPNDPVDILSKVGGFCIAEMTGMILKAASLGMPVVLDGFPVTSAALLACLADPNVKDYLFAGHLSAVKGHGALLKHLGLEPLLKLDMRLGEGTGAVLSFSILEAAVKMMSEMATFESANVSRGTEA